VKTYYDFNSVGYELLPAAHKRKPHPLIWLYSSSPKERARADLAYRTASLRLPSRPESNENRDGTPIKGRAFKSLLGTTYTDSRMCIILSATPRMSEQQ